MNSACVSESGWGVFPHFSEYKYFLSSLLQYLRHMSIISQCCSHIRMFQQYEKISCCDQCTVHRCAAKGCCHTKWKSNSIIKVNIQDVRFVTLRFTSSPDLRRTELLPVIVRFGVEAWSWGSFYILVMKNELVCSKTWQPLHKPFNPIMTFTQQRSGQRGNRRLPQCLVSVWVSACVGMWNRRSPRLFVLSDYFPFFLIKHCYF